MSTFVLIIATSLGLAGLYFLLASGLSLIFGLMDVLNLAHGVFFAVGGFAAWTVMDSLEAIGPLGLRFAVAVVVAAAVGFLVGIATEKVLIARNYGDHLAQILVTLGLGLAGVALLGGLYRYDPRPIRQPAWFAETTTILGARIPNSRILIFGVAVLLLIGLLTFLGRTRHGLIIRAGVENRQMVQALGIDVGRSFTLVFGIGGLLAAIGGALGAVYFNGITPGLGTHQLIFAFIVVVIGGLGSIAGTAIAALLVALTQQFGNFYVATGLGDLAVVGLLAAVLLIRPQGLLGRQAR
ncbi:MAG TPA: branched-chain amino acid ABC transporter permease [Euzebya sp.]|nr:branched-chain amino acid ABC transporter permease [Euzebya sp.]